VRFIRRHLFGLGPITHCQLVLGRPDCMARQGVGRHVPPPAPMRTLGPTGTTRVGDASRVPPAPPELPRRPPARRRRRSGPHGGRARAAQSGSHVTAQTGPSWARLPARRADTVRPRAGPPIAMHGPGPARARGGAQWCGPRAGSTSPGRGAVRRQSDADAGRPCGPAREGHVQRGACLGGGGSVQRVQRVGQGCQRRMCGQGRK
jgi:hypothetical protein